MKGARQDEFNGVSRNTPRRRAIVGAATCGLAALAALAVLPQPQPSYASTSSAPAKTVASALADQRIGEAWIDLATRRQSSAAFQLLKVSTPAEPLEIRFESGEWTGGVVVAGDTASGRAVLRAFLTSSPAARGSRPIFAIAASTHAVSTVLSGFDGPRSFRPRPSSDLDSTSFGSSGDSSSQDARRSSASASGQRRCDPDADCSEWINDAAGSPDVPSSGVLSQLRQQGVAERTHHELRGLSKKGYPALLHHVSMTQGHGGWIKPKYGYEHDYKVKNNGYVKTTANYSWSTNLPGAYRDTRASDSKTWLDFTVGSMFTWLFDSKKTYVIDTVVGSPKDGIPTKTTARLAAQVLPNDGAFTRADAIVGGGCKFVVDPWNGNTVPKQTKGNYAWCTGVGHGHGSQTAAYSYISLKPFTIRYTGTCRHWTLGKGARTCT